LVRRLGGPQSRSGSGGEEKNSPPPPGIELFIYTTPASWYSVGEKHHIFNLKVFVSIQYIYVECFKHAKINNENTGME
jgi:hypothetical protein